MEHRNMLDMYNGGFKIEIKGEGNEDFKTIMEKKDGKFVYDKKTIIGRLQSERQDLKIKLKEMKGCEDSFLYHATKLAIAINDFKTVVLIDIKKTNIKLIFLLLLILSLIIYYV